MDEEIKKEFDKIWKKINEVEFSKEIKANFSENEKERTKSMRELFLEFKLKNDLEKTLFVMHAGEDLNGLSEFSTNKVKRGFQEIREKPPQNIADKFQMLHKLGFIMPINNPDKSNKRKFWGLTNSGINFLEDKK